MVCAHLLPTSSPKKIRSLIIRIVLYLQYIRSRITSPILLPASLSARLFFHNVLHGVSYDAARAAVRSHGHPQCLNHLRGRIQNRQQGQGCCQLSKLHCSAGSLESLIFRKLHCQQGRICRQRRDEQRQRQGRKIGWLCPVYVCQIPLPTIYGSVVCERKRWGTRASIGAEPDTLTEWYGGGWPVCISCEILGPAHHVPIDAILHTSLWSSRLSRDAKTIMRLRWS